MRLCRAGPFLYLSTRRNCSTRRAINAYIHADLYLVRERSPPGGDRVIDAAILSSCHRPARAAARDHEQARAREDFQGAHCIVHFKLN